MKKLLLSSSILALLVPVFALAAYNDVTLTTSTIFSMGGISLNVSGSSAVVQSVVVNPTNMVVTLLPGSSITIVAPGRNVVSQSGGSSYLTVNQCDSNSSQMAFSYPAGAGGAASVTITPSGTLCVTASGAGGSSPASLVTPVTPMTAISTTTAVTATSITPVAPATPAAKPSGLSASQIQSILDILASFNADAPTIAKVRTSLQGTVVSTVTSTVAHVFKTNLMVGSLGSEVRALQQYLNNHGFVIVATGAGSPGNEATKFGPATRAALIKFQQSKGITPASGFFGAKTRAAMNAGN